MKFDQITFLQRLWL